MDGATDLTSRHISHMFGPPFGSCFVSMTSKPCRRWNGTLLSRWVSREAGRPSASHGPRPGPELPRRVPASASRDACRELRGTTGARMGAPLRSRSEPAGHDRTSHPRRLSEWFGHHPDLLLGERPGLWRRPYRHATTIIGRVDAFVGHGRANHAVEQQRGASVKVVGTEHPCNQRVVLKGPHLAMGSLRKIIERCQSDRSHRVNVFDAGLEVGRPPFRGGVSVHRAAPASMPAWLVSSKAARSGEP